MRLFNVISGDVSRETGIVVHSVDEMSMQEKLALGTHFAEYAAGRVKSNPPMKCRPCLNMVFGGRYKEVLGEETIVYTSAWVKDLYGKWFRYDDLNVVRALIKIIERMPDNPFSLVCLVTIYQVHPGHVPSWDIGISVIPEHLGEPNGKTEDN